MNFTSIRDSLIPWADTLGLGDLLEEREVAPGVRVYRWDTLSLTVRYPADPRVRRVFDPAFRAERFSSGVATAHLPQPTNKEIK
jgi:hypothetical protein